ncbi:hypothetical protein [Streptomyces sp. NPDC059970]|uniref:hypothetical protein n=1 Tax=Streptomyces sp. NPDC059970 TaxID=3347019 RepID=UPI003694E105
MTLALTGCSNSNPENGGKNSAGTQEETALRLGQASPEQESMMKATSGSKYTVTPTKVITGTAADIKKSGLDTDELPGPRVPVYVWTTLTHKSGKALRIGDMDDDLVIRTDTGDRIKALLVLLGDATWPNCPTPDTDKVVGAGKTAEICTAFLITRGEKAAAVELTQGFYADPVEWPVNS